MNKFLLIPDSFKGTLSSAEVCDTMRGAILAHYPHAQVVSIPVADGGEGSVDAFLSAMGGEKVALRVQGPHGQEVDSFYGMLPDGTAVVEMAAAAGLPLAGACLRPDTTTTYGVGQLMEHAARQGARRMVVALGGSATNDLGAGAAAAAGVRFTDALGKSFIPTGGTLHGIVGIDLGGMDPQLREMPITVMCDIDNPLYGPNGAAHIFGPQKGAGPAMVLQLDEGLRQASVAIQSELGIDIAQAPGAGAAGGMGGGMMAFFGARLQMGIETVLDTVDFSRQLQGTDAVITGEGRIDAQTLSGKVVAGVAKRAKPAGVPVFAVVGDIGEGVEPLYDLGVSGIFSINRVAVPFAEARQRNRQDLRLTVDNLMRLLRALGH